jgi:hypothetical protein
VRWRVPLGSLRAMAKVPGGGALGSISIGGTLVTSGRLVFVASTLDEHLRAFDLDSGRELWSAPLPAAGNALPMTYVAGGRQYVVIAAGGHDRLGPDRLGDLLMAYAIPEPGDARPDTLVRDLTGAWTGELRIEDRNRHPSTLALRAAGDSLLGDVRADDGKIAGTMAGHVHGRAFSFTLPFRFDERHCTGTITGQGEAANGGDLLEGQLLVETTCGDGPEHGTFSFRRSKG